MSLASDLPVHFWQALYTADLQICHWQVLCLRIGYRLMQQQQ
jgi:hypothetical protein